MAGRKSNHNPRNCHPQRQKFPPQKEGLQSALGQKLFWRFSWVVLVWVCGFKDAAVPTKPIGCQRREACRPKWWWSCQCVIAARLFTIKIGQDLKWLRMGVFFEMGNINSTVDVDPIKPAVNRNNNLRLNLRFALPNMFGLKHASVLQQLGLQLMWGKKGQSSQNALTVGCMVPLKWFRDLAFIFLMLEHIFLNFKAMINHHLTWFLWNCTRVCDLPDLRTHQPNLPNRPHQRRECMKDFSWWL